MVTMKKLSDGNEIPEIGFGLWLNKDREECIKSVDLAVKAGYRHFDTAQQYENEEYLAEGLKLAGLERKDAFITTKISVRNFIHVKKSFEKSLQNMQTDYVDLLLLHFPVTALRHGAWKHLEEIHTEGKAKSIGVSNYTVRHLEHLLKDCKVRPVINQVELHVFLQQPELLRYCQEQGIAVEAYSPLAHGQGMDDPVLIEIAEKHDKTPAQIMLRWCVDIGTIPLPKSVTAARIAENINIYDFKLDAEDMAKIQGLERDLRTCWDPTHVI
ncbi:aldo/keto reductase [soil metagenome]